MKGEPRRHKKPVKGPKEPLLIPPDRIDAAAILRQPPGESTQLTLRNVRHRVHDGIAVDILSLEGEIVRRDPTLPLVLDNIHSYTIAIHRGELAFSGETLSHLLNFYTFAFPESPLYDLRIRIGEGRIHLSGLLKRWMNIPFTVVARPEIVAGGGLAMQKERIFAGRMRVAALMDLFGMRLEKLVPQRTEQGLQVRGDTILIDLQRLLPPPGIQASATGVAIGDGQLRVTLSDGIQLPQPDLLWPHAPSYAHLSGGDVLTGNVLIKDVNLQLVGQSEHKPLELSLQDYHRQSDAGFTLSRDGKILVFIPAWEVMVEREAAGTVLPVLPAFGHFALDERG